MTVVLFALAALFLAAIAVIASEVHKKHITVWVGAFMRQDWRGQPKPGATKHLMFCFVDHYEPGWEKPSYETECARVARWSTEYPKL